MGFITNQWLEKSPERNRGHLPKKVVMKLHNTDTTWCKRYDVAGVIGATRYNGDYQIIYLTKTELNGFLPDLAKGADLETRKKIALRTLLHLRETELVDFLTDVLSKRRALKKSVD
ncbi:MAG: hypothetical protein HY274_09075 [Gammaproteobacteria bacterium]|nr:hypothetical protein [Gammaproteobacteria bacterium]